MGELEEEDGALAVTHNTAFCWGKCVFCYQFGHKASQCRNNPDSKELPGVGGVMK